MITENGAYQDLMEIPISTPPIPVLRLSGYEEPEKKTPQPDMMQFPFPGFAPKFGDVGKKPCRKRRTPAEQLSF